jgi:hypothetical protein
MWTTPRVDDRAWGAADEASAAQRAYRRGVRMSRRRILMRWAGWWLGLLALTGALTLLAAQDNGAHATVRFYEEEGRWLVPLAVLLFGLAPAPYVRTLFRLREAAWRRNVLCREGVYAWCEGDRDVVVLGDCGIFRAARSLRKTLHIGFHPWYALHLDLRESSRGWRLRVVREGMRGDETALPTTRTFIPLPGSAVQPVRDAILRLRQQGRIR